MMRTRSSLLHPFLFGAYPVLALLASNIEEVRAASAARPLLLSLLGTAVVFLVFLLVLRQPQKAALASTLTAALFFSYGHLYGSLEQLSVGGITLGRHRLLVPAWLLLGLVGLAWIVKKTGSFQRTSQVLSLVGGAALVLPLAQISLYQLHAFQAASGKGSAPAAQPSLHLPERQPAPDVYYIILDGYARDDILKKHYDYNNQPFLDALTSAGFYVAPCSQSNYAQTQLSLASSLNFAYLDALGDQFSPENTSRVGLPELIRSSAVRQAFESLGYRTIAFETGYEATQIEDADLYYSSQVVQGINDFENLFVRTTAGRIVSEGVALLNVRPDWEARDQAHRERILYTLEKLRQAPGQPGPKFVFAHLVSPHWPHVFGPDGEAVHEHPDSASGYRDQVVFLNRQIETIITEILAQSETPPVILLQADHGPVVEAPQRRMSILNAYYLPGGGAQLLYENISPVNSFRLVFNTYFGGRFDLLEDVSYYSTYDNPYSFSVIKEERPGCPAE